MAVAWEEQTLPLLLNPLLPCLRDHPQDLLLSPLQPRTDGVILLPFPNTTSSSLGLSPISGTGFLFLLLPNFPVFTILPPSSLCLREMRTRG